MLSQNDPKVSISACVIAYRSEQHIKGMLDSLKGFVDEIILVYDGQETDDRTLEIARAQAITRFPE